MVTSFVCIHCGGTAFRLRAADGSCDAECIACGRPTPIANEKATPPDIAKVESMIAPDRPE